MKPSKILLKRTRQMGDVLLTTPIIRALKDQGHKVEVITDYHSVIGNDIRNFQEKPSVGYYKVIDLDAMMYESKHRTHLVDAFADHAGVRTDHVLTRPIFIPNAAEVGDGCSIVIATAKSSWRGKDYPHWHKVSQELVKLPFVTVFWVGLRDPKDKDAPHNVIDLRGDFGASGLCRNIAAADLFIGCDSLPAHLASAYNTPSITLWGITSPKYLSCHQGPHICIEGTGRTAGARHDERVTRLDVNDDSAIRTIQPERVVEAARQMLSL